MAKVYTFTIEDAGDTAHLDKYMESTREILNSQWSTKLDKKDS